MQLLLANFLVRNRIGQIGCLITHMFQIGIIHVENPGVVLLGLLLMHLTLGPLKPLLTEILQTRVTILHQHRINKHVRVDNTIRIVVETDPVIGLEGSAHTV